MNFKFYFLFFLTIKLLGQFDSSLDVSTPQTSDFMRYGNIPVSKYTGQLDLSIPLFNTETKYFNIDLNMRYNSSGFIPSKQSSAVGLNWFLNAGGVIKRKVNHIPDEEQHRLYFSNGRTFGPAKHGFFYGVNKWKHPKSFIFDNTGITSGNTLSLNNSSHTEIVGWVDAFTADHYESNSDEFFFNFNGLSGKFFMDNQGEIRVVCNKPVHIKVNLDNFGSYRWLNLQNSKGPGTMSNSQIVLTTDDGIKYYFGGDVSALEYSFLIGFYNNIPLHPQYIASINSWHLTKVVAPNGDTMEYEYMDNFPERYDRNSYNSDNANNPFPIIIHKQHKFLKHNSTLHGSAWQPNGKLVSVSNKDAALTAVKTVYLKKIKVSNALVVNFDYNALVVNFDYSVKAHKFYKDTDYARSNSQPHIGANYNVKAYKLDQIFITGGGLSQKIVFNYDYSEDNYKRMFLRSVYKYGISNKLDDAEKYELQYLGLDVNKRRGPAPDTFGLDHWGFWNLKNSNSLEDLAPKENVNANGDVTGILSTNRNPNFTGASYGLLNKITYPTKGYSEFEYEAHRYSKRIEYKSGNFFRPKLYSISGTAGGTRIKKIKNNDGNGQVLTKEFKYSSGKNTKTTTSSGVLLQWPRYSFSYTQRIGRDNQVLTSNARALASYNPTIIDYSHITYGSVIEIGSGGDYNSSKFTTYETNPDTVAKIYDKDELSINPPRIGYLLGGNYMDSRKFERGKLIKEEYYSKDNRVVRKKEYKYNNYTSRFLDYYVEGHLSHTNRRSYVKRYYFNNYLSRIKDSSYVYINNSQNKILNEKIFKYHPRYNKLLSEETRTSNSEFIVRELKYPFSSGIENFIDTVWSNKSNVFEAMISKNRLPIIQETNYLQKSYDRKDFSIKLNTFRIKNDFYVIDKTYLKQKGSFYETISYDNYNDYGNPTKITQKDGPTTRYIWVSSGRFLTAKIDNFPQGTVPDNIKNKLNNIENGPFSQSYHDKFTFNDNSIRKDSFFKNSFITNYVDKPYVGLLSIKDPRGYKTSFTYDTQNRLEFVIDANGNKVSENKYNYKK